MDAQQFRETTTRGITKLYTTIWQRLLHGPIFTNPDRPGCFRRETTVHTGFCRHADRTTGTHYWCGDTLATSGTIIMHETPNFSNGWKRRHCGTTEPMSHTHRTTWNSTTYIRFPEMEFKYGIRSQLEVGWSWGRGMEQGLRSFIPRRCGRRITPFVCYWIGTTDNWICSWDSLTINLYTWKCCCSRHWKWSDNFRKECLSSNRSSCIWHSGRCAWRYWHCMTNISANIGTDNDISTLLFHKVIKCSISRTFMKIC